MLPLLELPLTLSWTRVPLDQLRLGNDEAELIGAENTYAKAITGTCRYVPRLGAE